MQWGSGGTIRPVDHLPPDDADRTETVDAVTGSGHLDPETASGIPELAGYALIVASGPRRGLHWTVGEGVEAGRDPESPIFLDDVTVSRHHAAFTVVDGALVVRDLGSTNGTYVNGVRCDEATLQPGDAVIIGRFHLVVARGA